MIKQTVTYGEWKVVRHDNNKIEVYSDGELCPVTTRALRLIAEELDMDINPDWRTAQLGANVIKAMLAAGGEKETAAEPEAEEENSQNNYAYFLSRFGSKGAADSLDMCEKIKAEMKLAHLDRFIFGSDIYNEEIAERSNVAWEDEDMNEFLLSDIITVQIFRSSNDYCDRFAWIMGFELEDGDLRFQVIKGTEDDNNGTTFDEGVEELSLVEIYEEFSNLTDFDVVTVLADYVNTLRGDYDPWIEK